jgi:hypothetical protein
LSESKLSVQTCRRPEERKFDDKVWVADDGKEDEHVSERKFIADDGAEELIVPGAVASSVSPSASVPKSLLKEPSRTRALGIVKVSGVLRSVVFWSLVQYLVCLI